MNKIKVRKIMLWVLSGVIVTVGIIGVLSFLKMDDFVNHINKKTAFDSATGKEVAIGTTGSVIVSLEQKASAFSSLIWVGVQSIFIIFGLIYAYSKSGKGTLRKWPYIVLIVLLSIASIFSIMNAANVSSKPVTYKDNAKIEATLKEIFENDYSSIKILRIVSVIGVVIADGIAIALLVLTKGIKNDGDVKYSQEIKNVQIQKQIEENDLP